MTESPQMRIGHLAADLLRVANFIESGSMNIAKPIIRESKFMAEWIAPDSDFETKQLLAEVQTFLALKEIRWSDWINDSHEVTATASTARNWSHDLLNHSGLVRRPRRRPK